jgi:hypothetical protein
MGALLSRIGREIGDRVEGAVSLGELFRMPAAEAGALLRTSRTLLEQWHSTYMQVRRARLPVPSSFPTLPQKPIAQPACRTARLCCASPLSMDPSCTPPNPCTPSYSPPAPPTPRCARQVRERIELSGRDARWEFPKGPLFGRTNYMAEICGALAEMVEVVDDFFKFLGPELKAVAGERGRQLPALARGPAAVRSRGRRAVEPRGRKAPESVPGTRPSSPAPETLPLHSGDTKGIDDVIERVQLMLEPVETAMFNVFDAAHAAQWRALRARFYADNEEVKAATVGLGFGGLCEPQQLWCAQAVFQLR